MTSYGDSGAYGDPYPAQDYPAQDYPAQGYSARDYPAQDYPAQDYPAQGYSARDYPAQDHGDRYGSSYGSASASGAAGRASVPASGFANSGDTGRAYGGYPGDGARDDRHGPDNGHGEPGYGAAGAASVSPAGRASVPPASGRAGVGGAAAGRASVPSATGRAGVSGTAGRASVRPASPGGPGGPGGPTGPGGGGPGGSGPGGPNDPSGPGRGRGGKGPRGKKRRWRTIAVLSLAMTILMAGGGMMVLTWMYSDVKEPGELDLTDNTLVYYADNGKTPMAKLGENNRLEVDMAKIDQKVKLALIAGEDTDFYNHDGVSLWGIARAAWNNLTGGSTQGASTITQQYVKIATKNAEISYVRKLNEAMAARKLEQKYDKDTILSFYVNSAWYGRSSVGWGAAAKAYFGKTPDKVTVAEAAVLGGVVKQPEPYMKGDTIDESRPKGFDPHYDLEAAKHRWGYVLDNMVKVGWLTSEERAGMEYPKILPYKPGQYAGEKGYQGVSTGNVINYVDLEMRQWGYPDWKKRGFKITTTINSKAQAALEKQLWRDFKYREKCTVGKKEVKKDTLVAQEDGSYQTAAGKKAVCQSVLDKAVDRKGTQFKGTKKNLIGAGVSLDPSSGGVLAYYGGLDPTGVDFAGVNSAGTEFEFGGHPPASSFKIYTLAAALENNISINSRWDPTPFSYNGTRINNANRDGTPGDCGKYCTLEQMTLASYNVPFFKIVQTVGVEKVVDLAKRAGVRSMWTTDDGKVRHLDEKGAKFGRETFDYHIGFGQYPITVLDHAAGVATFAADGVYHKPHFVTKVEEKDPDTGKWRLVKGTGHSLNGTRAFRAEIAQEVTGVLKKIPGSGGHALNGREAAGKTGTWENGKRDSKGNKVYPGESAHAWFVGYTAQMATAIWVGNVKEELPIRDKYGNKVSGGGMPGEIWERYMNDVHSKMKIKRQSLSSGHGGRIGDENKGDGQSPTPEPTPSEKCKPNQWWCGLDPSPGTGEPGEPGNPGLPGRDNGTGGLLSPTPRGRRVPPGGRRCPTRTA